MRRESWPRSGCWPHLFSPHFGASLQMLKLEIGDRTYRYGPAGVGSLGYYPVRYPSFTVRQAGL